MTNQNLTPKIRFKGFSDPWEQRKFFSNVIETLDHRGKTPRKLGMDWTEKGEYLALSAINVKPGYINKKITTHYADQELYNKWMGKDAIVKGDIVLTTEAPMGNVAIIPDNKGYILSQRVIGFKLNGQITNNLFWFEYLSSSIFQNRIDSISSGGTAKGISQKTLKDINTLVPKNIEEQRHIGKLLSTVDNLIAANEYKLKQLKELKRLLMQKIFSQEWRFKGFADPWEQRKLKELVERVTRKNKELQSNLPLTISAQYGLVDQNTFFNKQVASRNISDYYVIKKGEFAYNKSYSNGYPVGTVKRLDKYSEGVLSTLYIVFTPINIDSEFLVTYFEGTMWYQEITKRATEGARNHGLLNIAPKDFFDMNLSLPTYDEQIAIGVIVQKLDTLIAANEDKLKQLKELKQFLMQNMFI